MRTSHRLVFYADTPSEAPIGFSQVPTTHQQVRVSLSLRVIASFRDIHNSVQTYVPVLIILIIYL